MLPFSVVLVTLLVSRAHNIATYKSLFKSQEILRNCGFEADK